MKGKRVGVLTGTRFFQSREKAAKMRGKHRGGQQQAETFYPKPS